MSLTLTYFDIRGYGEIPRILLAAAGVQYKDDRVECIKPDGSFEIAKVWASELKPQQPFAQIPVLTTESGVKIAQSTAITRYIGRKYNFAGANEEENAQLDAALEQIVDLRRTYFNGKSDAEKTAKFWETGLNEQLALLEKNFKGEYFNGKISYVDIALYYNIWVLESENKEAVTKALAANPKVNAVFTGVPKLEKVAAYLAARPARPF